MPLAAVAGGHIHYQTAGGGPLLVALHGIGGNHRSWRRQLAALADAYTVVAWDARGYGGSSDPDGPWAIDDYADDVAGLLDHLGAARAHVLGISWGGVIALACYPPAPGARDVAAARRYLPRRGYPARAGALSAPGATAGGHRVAQSGAARSRARRRCLRRLPTRPLLAEAQSIMAEIHPTGYRQAAIALANADETAVLPRIAVPTLVLCGDQDGVLPLPESETLAREIPGARLVVIPKRGHASNQEQPDAFNTAVRAFLQVQQDVSSARV